MPGKSGDQWKYTSIVRHINMAKCEVSNQTPPRKGGSGAVTARFSISRKGDLGAEIDIRV